MKGMDMAHTIVSQTALSHGLVAEGLSKSFGRRQVVNGVTLSLERGQVMGLLGPNGAGKTTCFYMITGLIGTDDGTIWMDGEDVTALPMYQRARLGLSYLPQEPSIFRGLSVRDNVYAVAEMVNKHKFEAWERTEALLDELRIGHLASSPAVALSGGERRRVEIARALATDPSFILLDEPFAGIDPMAIDDIREVIGFLKARGIGVLITDHNVRETLDIVDRAYIIASGEVLFEGTPQEVRTNKTVRKAYLGDRYQ